MFRPVKIRQYVAFMRAKGISAEEVLAGTGIGLVDLDNPQLLIDQIQALRIVRNMMQALNDSGLGFEIGTRSRIPDLGITGHAVMSAHTLRRALEIWVAYSNSLVGMLSQLALDEEKDRRWTLSISGPHPAGPVDHFCVEEILAMILNLGRVLMDKPMVPERLELSYPEPPHAWLYRRYFDCPIAFDCSRTRVTFEAPALDTRFPGNDEEFNEICRHHCSRIMQEISQGGRLVSQLRELLLRTRGQIPSLPVAAAELHVSARTLRRHLLDEGTSYNRVVQEFRHQLACEYLQNTQMAPKEIAFVLGFHDADAFRRAFKTWTGQTVSDFKAAATASR